MQTFVGFTPTKGLKILALLFACAVPHANCASFDVETSWVGDVLHIEVKTDAPERSQFFVHIVDRKTGNQILNDLDTSLPVNNVITVENGRLVIDGFTRDGKPFPPGQYGLAIESAAVLEPPLPGIPITIPSRSKNQKKITTARGELPISVGAASTKGPSKETPAPTTKEDEPNNRSLVLIGEMGVLRGMGKGASIVLVCADKEAVEQRDKAFLANDEAGIQELAMARRLMMVQPGTKVKVLDLNGFLTSIAEIRILEGPHEGRRGFVLSSEVAGK